MRPLGITLGILAVVTVGVADSPVFAQPAVQVVLQDGSITPAQISGVKNKALHISIVNQGNQVHNFVIPDFYIFTSNLSPGGQTTVEFTPDKTGSFKYYSDKNGVPEQGMHGTLTVTS